MDAVRFGRALGIGARQAVKTVASAVDAATAENPSGQAVAPPNTGQTGAAPGRTKATRGTVEAAPQRTTAKAAHTVAQGIGRSRQVSKGLKTGTRRFGEAVWGPFVRLSGVLWLEVVGVFFGIFAVFAFGHLWRLRGEWHAAMRSPAEHQGLLGALVMVVLFGYFCVTSFVRARQRERRG